MTAFVESDNSMSALSRHAQTSATYADEFKFSVSFITVRGHKEVSTHKEKYQSACSDSNGYMTSVEFAIIILG